MQDSERRQGFRHRGRRAALAVLLIAPGLLAATPPEEPHRQTVDARWQIADQHGAPLADVVVTLTPIVPGSTDPAPAANPAGRDTPAMVQRNRRFQPEVLLVERGSEVRFPNEDDVQHHVYSFSPAKVFELKLYHGERHDPIRFDRAGLVELGCNIHDHMRGYIFVSDSPLTAKADGAGQVTVPAVPPGDYRLELWHPRQLEEFTPRTLSLPLDADGQHGDRLMLAVAPPPQPVKLGLKAWMDSRD